MIDNTVVASSLSPERQLSSSPLTEPKLLATDTKRSGGNARRTSPAPHPLKESFLFLLFSSLVPRYFVTRGYENSQVDRSAVELFKNLQPGRSLGMKSLTVWTRDNLLFFTRLSENKIRRISRSEKFNGNATVVSIDLRKIYKQRGNFDGLVVHAADNLLSLPLWLD